MILGIDPGLHGALVLYDPATGRIVSATNLPTFELKRNGKLKNSLDIHALVALIREWAPKITQAFLELVGPMPKQGVSSVWSFSQTECAPKTALIAFNVPFTRVTPQVWKKAVGAPADKDGARARASQLMPLDAFRWTPKRLVINKEQCEGIAEAALIAYYGAQKFVLTPRWAASYNGAEHTATPT
jgi:crossover junction endodeoxyribonuclease RuvC